jgi:hypothetical protein
MSVQKAPADQQNLSQVMAVGGGSGPLNIPALKAQVGATNVYQFSADFQMVFGSGLCDFRHGCVYGLHPALKTALLAASAPMTQV